MALQKYDVMRGIVGIKPREKDRTHPVAKIGEVLPLESTSSEVKRLVEIGALRLHVEPAPAAPPVTPVAPTGTAPPVDPAATPPAK